MTVLLRKATPGSDSYGHEWRTERSVVPVSDEQAADLLAIADAGFTVVQVAEAEEEPPPPPPPADETGGDENTPDPVPSPDPEAAGDEGAQGDEDPAPAPDDDEPVLEIDPAKDDATPAPARPRKAAARRRSE